MCCFISSQQKVAESHSPRGTWLHITSAPARPCDKPALPIAAAWGQRTGLLCMVTGPGRLGEGGTLLCHSGTQVGWPAAPVSQVPRPSSSPTPGPSHGLTACPHGSVCKRPRAANDPHGHHRAAVLPSVCQPGHHPDRHPNDRKYTAASKPSHVAQHSHPGLLLTWLTCPSSSGWGSDPSPSTEGKCPPTPSTQEACQPRLTKHLRHPRRQTLKESQHRSLLSLVF